MAVNVLPCCLMVFLTCFLYGQNLAIHIKITPDVYNMIKDDAVHISCAQNNEVNSEIKEIFLLEITKDGKPVVILRQNSHLSFANGNNERIKAVGHIDKDVSKSYLNLTLTSPQSQDSGVYSCAMDYLDEVNIIKVEKDSKNLTEQKLDVQSVAAAFAFLKLEMLSNKMSDKKEIDILKKQVRELNEKTSNQSALIHDLKHKDSIATAFSVTAREKIITSVQGGTLILPDIIMVQGTGYDVATGVFTAPVPGLYVFHLVVNAEHDYNDCELEIVANGKSVGELSTDQDEKAYSQSSITSAVDLKVGETVHAVMDQSGCTYYADGYTMFSGYLLKAW